MYIAMRCYGLACATLRQAPELGVGAANQNVADSQQMIKEFPCPMRGDMPARNAGNTRRFEDVAIENPCHMQCDIAARNAEKTLHD